MANEWDNITLEQFVKIRAVLEDKEKSKEDKMVSLAAVVEGVDEKTILEMPLEKVGPVFERVQGLDTPPQKGKARSRYQVGKWLLRLTGAKDMSVAQWIDVQTYYRDMDNHLADILSVALVPVEKRYNEGYDIEELKAALWSMYVKDALAVCFFFRRWWLKSMRRILTFLVGWSAVKGQRKLMRKALEVREEVSGLLRSL